MLTNMFTKINSHNDTVFLKHFKPYFYQNYFIHMYKII